MLCVYQGRRKQILDSQAMAEVAVRGCLHGSIPCINLLQEFVGVLESQTTL